MKNETAQRCGSGIRATARGKAMNANPIPEKASRRIIVTHNITTVYICTYILETHTNTHVCQTLQALHT